MEISDTQSQNVYFSADTWNQKISLSYGVFKGSFTMLEDNHDLYLPNFVMQFSRRSLESSDEIDNKTKAEVANLKMNFKATLEDATMFLFAQTIVLLNTYVEIMLAEYSYLIFIKYPLRMNPYLFTNDKKGYVALNTIIKSETKEELINEIAWSAASQVVDKGKIISQLNRIENISKIHFPEPLKNSLQKLSIKRNLLVHEEPNQYDLTIEDVEESFDVIILLVKELCHFCTKNQIRVTNNIKYTVSGRSIEI